MNNENRKRWYDNNVPKCVRTRVKTVLMSERPDKWDKKLKNSDLPAGRHKQNNHLNVDAFLSFRSVTVHYTERRGIIAFHKCIYTYI